MATLDEIKALFDQQKLDLIQIFEQRFLCLQKEVDEANTCADEARKLAEINANKVETLNTTIDDLQSKVATLENHLDEQSNRVMRSTVTLRNVEKTKDETWEITKQLASEVIGFHLKQDARLIYNMIDVAHRGGGKENQNNNNGPPNIFIKFKYRCDADLVLKDFSNLNQKNKTLKIRCEPKYTKALQDRRNSAMQKRRSLLEDKEITNGYVKYPAILMVKNGRNDTYKPFNEHF